MNYVRVSASARSPPAAALRASRAQPALPTPTASRWRCRCRCRCRDERRTRRLRRPTNDTARTVSDRYWSRLRRRRRAVSRARARTRTTCARRRPTQHAASRCRTSTSCTSRPTRYAHTPMIRLLVRCMCLPDVSRTPSQSLPLCRTSTMLPPSLHRSMPTLAGLIFMCALSYHSIFLSPFVPISQCFSSQI